MDLFLVLLGRSLPVSVSVSSERVAKKRLTTLQVLKDLLKGEKNHGYRLRLLLRKGFIDRVVSLSTTAKRITASVSAGSLITFEAPGDRQGLKGLISLLNKDNSVAPARQRVVSMWFEKGVMVVV